MALTIRDPTPALVVIDLQQGILTLPAVHPITEVVRRTSIRADAFRHRGLPVVLVSVAGGAPGRTEQPMRGGERPANWADLLAALHQHPDDLTVTTRTWGAFTNADHA